MSAKKEIRELVKTRIKGITLDNINRKSADILNWIESHPFFKSAETVMLYWSMDNEAMTHAFIEKWSKKKTILLPCIENDNIVVKKFLGIKNLAATPPYGIMEPTGDEYKGKIDLIIVPGVAFDKHNNRIGHGKGYYDRFLKTFDAYKIGICFDFQFFDEIPSAPDDVKMDEVISDLKSSI